jgi:Fe-S oxidoreductase
VVLLPDTFNTWFEPENLRAAVRVLEAAGYWVNVASHDSGRPLCCGRTFLAAGLVDEARVEAKRTLRALRPYLDAGIPVVGLEPSCLLTLRDEWSAMLPEDQLAGVSEHSFLFEEFLARETESGRCELRLAPIRETALLHGHCHQKAFEAMSSVHAVLNLIPELQWASVESSCCGMAGAFGYAAETYGVSVQMAELELAPAVRESDPETLIVADGISCRHQIEDTTSRHAIHCARLLDMALVEEGHDA